jgi:integrase
MKRQITYRKRGVVYYYKFADEPTYHSTGQSSRGKAEDWVAKHAPKGDDILLKDYLAPYYLWEGCPLIAHRQKFGPSMGVEHAQMQRSRLERFVFKAPIGEKKLQELRRGDVLDWLSEVERGHGAGTANHALGALKACLRHALFREDMERDICFGIGSLKNVQYRERGVLAPEEVRKMFFEDKGWGHPRERIALLLGAMAGLRRGELLLLQWGDVNFEGSYLTVQRAWKTWQKKIVGPPKWGKPRVVPMLNVLREELAGYHETTTTPRAEHCIISWDDGSYVSPRSVGWWMDAALKRIGADKRARNLTPHSLRHTFVTFLENAGLREFSIQQMAGHTSSKVTQGYKHKDPARLVAEIQRAPSTLLLAGDATKSPGPSTEAVEAPL